MRTALVTLDNGTCVKLRKLYAGCYRMDLSGQMFGKHRFGQVRNDFGEWIAEIRVIESGNIVRYAGRWKTRRDAVAELMEVKI